MDQVKSWFQSKAVWGGVLAFLGAVLGYFGIDFAAADQAEAVEFVSQLAAAVGGLLAIWGRVKAEKRIG